MPTAVDSPDVHEGKRWSLGNDNDIQWDVARDKRLPHEDHLEMSGLRVSSILTYRVDTAKRIHVQNLVIWPSFIIKFDYRSYLMDTVETDDSPVFFVDGRQYAIPPVEKITFNGMFSIDYKPSGIVIRRTLFPSTDKSAVFDLWQVTNLSPIPVAFEINDFYQSILHHGAEMDYLVETQIHGAKVILNQHESKFFWIEHSARPSDSTATNFNVAEEFRARSAFIQMLTEHLNLETPDSIINQEFRFAKIRAAESIFATKIGYIHSPGGGRYYGGIWANDQLQYTHPFFAYLGYDLANTAALNGYRIYMPSMTPEFHRLPYSFEMGGALPVNSKDRGDAAMFADGASLYALTLGDESVARVLWPAIQWCLEYCERKMTPDSVVASDTDEMEGRLPTGDANLSTSTFVYGALVNATHLARELKEPACVVQRYAERAIKLRRGIEKYFGADIDGYHTYRYYAGYTKLRHWICLPLVMGIDERKEGTIKALLEKLWTPNGLDVENGLDSFWDRATLFALRGILISGATEEGIDKLKFYTGRRLLGEHVPYPVEAYPEGDQAHLSAESALYCRVIIEGLFGIHPIGLKQFECTPRLPAGWKRMSLNDIYAFGTRFSAEVRNESSNRIRLTVTRDGTTLFSEVRNSGGTFHIHL
ncbi:MAG: hypothetical protein WBW71_01635 [Bacteroidota bacterium]